MNSRFPFGRRRLSSTRKGSDLRKGADRSRMLQRAVSSLEALEHRQMFALLGITPTSPTIETDVSGSVNYTYSAGVGTFDLSDNPFIYNGEALIVPTADNQYEFKIRFRVDGNGNVLGGVSGADFSVVGTIDTNFNFTTDPGETSGVLLTGEILQFGFQDFATPPDLFDFRFQVTGGLLSTLPAFTNRDIGVVLGSEGSTFNGDFTQNFTGGSKPIAGPIPKRDEQPEPSSLSGVKYRDLAGNGVIDAVDPGLSNVTINLFFDDNNNGVLDGPDGLPVQTTATAANGSFTFNGVFPGRYFVQEVVPPGSTQTFGGNGGNDYYTVNVNTGAAQTITSLNFANTQQTSVHGYKFNDVDGNGAHDAGEAKLPGWTITLTGTDGLGRPVSLSTVTDADGEYDFTGLYPGVYTIAEVQQADWVQTAGGVQVTLTSGQERVALVGQAGTLLDGQTEVVTTGLAFGNFQLGKIRGQKFNDLDGDGTQDVGDNGIGQWTIELLNTSNVVLATTTTDANGFYEFAGLTPGTYRVREVGQTGWTQTTVNPNDVTVVSGLISANNNFGNTLRTSVHGYKFNDVNGNGIDNTDPRLTGWTITLIGTDGKGNPVNMSVVTGAGGEYAFNNLYPGTYTIAEVQQTGWTQTTGGATVTLTSGQEAVAYVGEAGVLLDGQVEVVDGRLAFGNFQKGKIRGQKFNDQDGDGTQETGDNGLAGWTIQLLDTNNNVLATTATGAGGFYEFADLAPGTYRVRELGQTGWTQTTVNPNDVTVVSGTDSGNNSFGNTLRTSVHGYKFQDANGNGIDNNEPRLAGWTIKLVGTDGKGNAVSLTTVTTSPNGEYEFTNLYPGTYTVSEELQSGWVQLAGGASFTLTSGQERVAYTGEAGTLLPGQVEVQTAGLAFGNGLPGIDLEKTTNGPTNSNPVAPDYDNEDSMNGPGVPILTPGSTVTWTYKVTNTGNIPYTTAQITLVDDNGTPANAADDLSIANGKITFSAFATGDNDNLLEPGEVWLYTASGIVQDLGTSSSSSGTAVTINLSGNTALDGTDGNVRTFSAGGVSVKVSGFSRDKSNGAWSPAYLGAYGGGVGVTDSSEGSGGSDMHTVDNVGRDNYVLFRFDQQVVVDAAFLGYVVGDSDIRVWIGNIANAYNVTVNLSDATLASLGFTEVNATTLSSTRLADFNAGNLAGNVLVIAADPGDTSPDDRFKIELLKVKTVVDEHLCYENKAVVIVPGDTDDDLSHYCNPEGTPGIDIEKTTNGPTNSNPTLPDYDNEDSPNGAGVPVLTPGSAVTWTYKVTNTGTRPFAFNEVVLSDDNGTPANTADDLSTTNGQITFLSVQTGDADNILEPGEVWLYKATGVVQALPSTGTGTAATFDFSGSSALDGTDGNVRTFTAGTLSVKASGFSRDKSTGAWAAAWLGSYAGGLGVTDSSEGDGSGDMHTVDNSGRDNYVLLEFNQDVILDSAFLGYVVNDSDITVWIGTIPNAFNVHQTLSDALLASLGFVEVNTTGSSGTRTANLNAGNVAGNVVVIAARTSGDDGVTDRFKLDMVTVQKPAGGVYQNKGTVTVPGDSDSDLSHYKNNPAANIDIEKYVKKVVENTPGGEGLTPGFWKQSQHFYAWTAPYTPYSPAPAGYVNNYNTVFGLPAGEEPSTLTLLQALGRGGGANNALGRHAVAALLNAANPNVDYAYTTAQIIAMVKQAYATNDFEATKNLLATENEKGADLTDTEQAATPSVGYGDDADTAPGITVSVGDTVQFTFVVTNPGPVALQNVVVVDDNGTPSNTADDYNPTPVLEGGFNIGDDDNDNILDVGETWVYTSTRTAVAGQHTNTAVVTGKPVGGGSTVTDSDKANYNSGTPTARIDIEKYVAPVTSSQPGGVGGEGLTPGFWKQSQHFYAWVGYTQTQSYNAVFGVADADSPTLLGALGRGGGGANALGRHAVAALLNAANPNVSYAYTTAQIIAGVQYAYSTGDFETIKNLLAVENEKGADLSPTATAPAPTVGFGSDADTAPGITVSLGSQVKFTFVVTNPGQTELTNVIVVDDNETPGNTADDYNPTPVLVGSFNTGDDDQDGRLDPGEVWLYTTGPRTVTAGQHTNVAKVTGTAAVGGSTVTDSDAANYNAQAPGGTITGNKYRDVTGNGLTADDTGLGGVTILLYKDKNNDGVLNSYDGSAVASTVTASGSGSYSFINLASGTYFVKEVVQTGWVRTAPALTDTYKVVLSSGETEADKDFANYETPCTDCDFTNVKYKVNNTVVPDLRGYTRQGDVITVTFTYTGDQPAPVTLVSYYAPGSSFSESTASQQTIYDADTIVAQPGMTYTLTVENPNCYFQVDFVCGYAIDTFGPAGSNVFYTPQNRLISADNGGTTVCSGYASISGFVYVDQNRDGEMDFGEQGIQNVKITLRNTVTGALFTDYTDVYGAYDFNNLPAGTYELTETDPANINDGIDTKGNGGGFNVVTANDKFSNIKIRAGDDNNNWNFGENLVNGATLSTAQTATIGFWKGTKGQALIKALNGGSSATQLGNWLANNFTNLFGLNAGDNNLAGKTNSEVAAFFVSAFNARATTIDAQVLAVALAVYVTDSGTAGTVATGYGFKVDSVGVGNATFNVGSNGAAFGVANNTVLTINQILRATDALSAGGAGSLRFEIYNGNETLEAMANNVYNAINNAGGIV